MVASPALAAPSFEPATVVAARSTRFALRVPAEGHGRNLRVIAQLIEGFVVDACASSNGWRCRIVRATQPPRTVVTYEWADASVPPSSDVVTFTARAPTTAAALRIEVDQFYVDGHVVYWGGSANKPAASLTVIAAPTTTLMPMSTTSTTTALADASSSHGSNLPVVLLVFALMLGVVVPVVRAGTQTHT